MSLFPKVLKSLMPIIATAVGFSLIYVTSLPMPDEGQSVGGEMLSLKNPFWLSWCLGWFPFFIGMLAIYETHNHAT